MRAPIRVFPDLEALSNAAADNLGARIADVLQHQPRFSIVLSGGNTPKRLYECLADRFAATMPWSKIHLFWGDERYVSPDDPRSNFRLARLALLDRISIPSTNIHPIS